MSRTGTRVFITIAAIGLIAGATAVIAETIDALRSGLPPCALLALLAGGSFPLLVAWVWSKLADRSDY